MTGPTRIASRTPFDLSETLPLMVAQVITEAEAHYWRRRARTYRDGRPRPGDFTGRATPQQLADRYAHMTAKAEACEHRARLCELTATEEHIIFELIAAAGADLDRLNAADTSHELQATG